MLLRANEQSVSDGLAWTQYFSSIKIAYHLTEPLVDFVESLDRAMTVMPPNRSGAVAVAGT